MAVKEHIKPLGNRVLVKRSEIKLSKGGILLPETAQEKPRQGEVVAVGPGKYDDKGVATEVMPKFSQHAAAPRS